MLNVGDKVTCARGNIDRGLGEGAVGYVTGFARFSQYHSREVWVSNVKPGEGNSSESWCGWFWESSLKPAYDLANMVPANILAAE